MHNGQARAVAAPKPWRSSGAGARRQVVTARNAQRAPSAVMMNRDLDIRSGQPEATFASPLVFYTFSTRCGSEPPSRRPRSSGHSHRGPPCSRSQPWSRLTPPVHALVDIWRFPATLHNTQLSALQARPWAHAGCRFQESFLRECLTTCQEVVEPQPGVTAGIAAEAEGLLPGGGPASSWNGGRA